MTDIPQKPQDAPPALQFSIDEQVALGNYINFANIIHNGAEFVIDFGRVVPGRNDVRVVSRIISSPFHVKQLLGALAQNIALYEKTYGAIRTDFEGQTAKLPAPHEPN